jgi:hypothetical protein
VAKPLITADVLIPDLVFEVTNEENTVRAMASVIARAVKKNTVAGKDAFGRKMPAPKDKGSKQNPDGKALKRTGLLIAEISAHQKKKSRRKTSKSGKKSPIAYGVKSAGKRPKKENVAAKKKRAREKTKQARAAAVLGEAFGQLGTGRAVSRSFKLRSGFTSTGKARTGIRLGRIRFRTADTNAALAGILSAPPKDRRSKAGNRAQYRVFVASPEYEALGNQQANKTIRYKMGEKRKIKVKK